MLESFDNETNEISRVTQTNLTNYPPGLTKNCKIARKTSRNFRLFNLLSRNINFTILDEKIIKLSRQLSPFFHLWCLIFNPSFFPTCFFSIFLHFPPIVFYSFCTPISLVDFYFFFFLEDSLHTHIVHFLSTSRRSSSLQHRSSSSFASAPSRSSFLSFLFFFLLFLFPPLDRFAIAINLSVSLVCSSDGNDTVAIDFAGSG